MRDGWVRTTLGEICQLHYGKGLKQEDYCSNGCVQVFGTGGLIGTTNLSEQHIGPSIVIGRKGSINSPIFIEDSMPFRVIDTAYYLTTKQDMNFIFYLISFMNLNKWNEASGVPSLNRDTFYSIDVNIPSIAEQKRIAEILLTWDESIEKIDQIIFKMVNRKRIIQKIFFEPKKNTEIITLREVAKKIGSGSTPKGGSAVYTRSGIPFIRSQNVLFGSIDLSNVAFISDEIHNSMRGTWVEPGDVLLNITGASIGRSCVISNNFVTANVNQHVCIIRLTSKLLPVFLSQYLNSCYGQIQINSSQGGGSREGLNFEQIGDFRIPLVSLHHQNKASNLLKTCDDTIQQYAKYKLHITNQKRALMQKMLTGLWPVTISDTLSKDPFSSTDQILE